MRSSLLVEKSLSKVTFGSVLPKSPATLMSPLFPPVDEPPGLVCPCHYSTFDPATGGTVVYGPAGRPLPQLPLMVDRRGNLRAAGNYSGPVGPSWWGVRNRKVSS